MTSNIHFNILHPSDLDTVELGQAVEDRFLDLCGTYLRIRGETLPIPQQLYPDMLRWREMRVRHRAGDLRNTESELRSVKALAQWTVDENLALRGQQAVVVEWKE